MRVCSPSSSTTHECPWLLQRRSLHSYTVIILAMCSVNCSSSSSGSYIQCQKQASACYMVKECTVSKCCHFRSRSFARASWSESLASSICECVISLMNDTNRCGDRPVYEKRKACHAGLSYPPPSPSALPSTVPNLLLMRWVPGLVCDWEYCNDS